MAGAVGDVGNQSQRSAFWTAQLAVHDLDQLLDEVWGFEYYGDSRTVDVHIKRLRAKLEGVSDQWSIGTVWSIGYKFILKTN